MMAERAPLIDHLRELRRRIALSLVAVFIGSIVTFAFADTLITLLRSPLGSVKLYFTGIGDAFGIRMQLSVIGGIALAMPMLLWQSWAFISPGLTRSERRSARPWLPLALLLFLIGAAVAWSVLPFAVGFLLSFASADLLPMIAADRYFGFVGTLILIFALAAEYPIVLVFLSRVGIVTSAKLRAWRRGAIVGIVVISTVATPGTDLVSPVILAVTLIILYEFSILLVRGGGR
ncbi:MAG: twin-arginine translocase subunit TatC [Chloroflexota bacterium]|jgi:sec-independent protein translocase protein TatC